MTVKMHSFAIWTLIWIAFISQSVQRPETQTSFITAAEDAIRNVSKILDIKKCFMEAYETAKKAGGYNRETRMAMTWLSMCARKCEIDEEKFSQDRTPKELLNFPFRLNKELRCLYHPNRDPSIREVFLRAGKTIDDAFEILEQYCFPYTRKLFKGVKDFPYRNKAFYVEEGFLSVSEDVNIALKFADGNVLLIVENMIGLNMKAYAADEYKNQQEVLAKRNSLFKIEKIVTKTDKINQELNTIEKDIHEKHPREIIYLYQNINSNANDGQNIAVCNAQRTLSRPYCDP